MGVPFAEKIISWRDRFQIFINYLTKAVTFFLQLGLAMLLFSIIFHVVGRYFFGKTYMGTMEFVRYLTIWISLLGAAVAFGTKEHVIVNILENYLPKEKFFWIGLFGNILLCTFLVLLFVGGIQISLKNLGQLSIGLKLPMFYPYLSVPLSALLMLVYVGNDLMNSLASRVALVQRSSNDPREEI